MLTASRFAAGWILSALSLTVGSTTVAAEAKHPYLTSTHHVHAGIFEQSADVALTAQRGDFDPVAIDFDDLGLSSSYTSFFLDYRYRLNDRWRLGATAYRFRQGTFSQATRDFNFAGSEFEAGAEINTFVGLDTYVVSGSYSFYQTDQAEVALGFGLHAIDIEAGIEGEATLNGEVVGNIVEARTTLLAPLPNVRASAFYAFNEKLSVSSTLGWLSASVDDYSGSFEYAQILGQYQISGGLGIAVGYQFLNIEIDERLGNGFNDFELEFSGLLASLSYDF